MGENRIRFGCGVMLVISKCFAKSEFQSCEPNFGFGTVNMRTAKLLQTLSQHYYLE